MVSAGYRNQGLWRAGTGGGIVAGDWYGNGNSHGNGYPMASIPPGFVAPQPAPTPWTASPDRSNPPGAVRGAVVLMFGYGGVLLLIVATVVPGSVLVATAIPVRRGRRVAALIAMVGAALNAAGILVAVGDVVRMIMSFHEGSPNMAFARALQLALGPTILLAVCVVPVAVPMLLLRPFARRYRTVRTS